MNDVSPQRVFILGIDGVPWDLIERWSTSGELPAFSRLRTEGSSGPLQSTIPATTPAAWPAISTGCGPEQHGVFGFMQLSSAYGQRPHTGADIELPHLWDLITPAVVSNVPMTYPATAIEGQMVCGMMSPELDDQFTHPPSLRHRIESQIPGYDTGLDWQTYHGRESALVTDLYQMTDHRHQLMDMLLADDDWRLAFFVFTAPDRLQHLIWDDHQLLKLYSHFDDILAEIIDRCETADATLFVVSDHGFGPVSRTIHVNRLLADAGLLTPTDDGHLRTKLERIGLRRERVIDVLERIGIDLKALIDTLPESVLTSVASTLPGDHALYDVDFEQTHVFMHQGGCIYINDTDRFSAGCVPPEDIEQMKQRVISALTSVPDPHTGSQAMSIVDVDHASIGRHGRPVPDLLVDPHAGYSLDSRLIDQPFSHADHVADHRPTGILLGWGPSIASDHQVDEATVTDIAPTVLHLLDCPVPENTDGRVLTELFSANAPAAKRDVVTERYGSPQRDAAESRDYSRVEDRLRGLGYLK